MEHHDEAGRPADGDLPALVATARALLGRLNGELGFRGDLPAATRATLAETGETLARLARSMPVDADAADAGTAAQGAALVFDVSDLIGYFATNRLPTGIQRVQAELIFNALRAPAGEARSMLCCFVQERDEWVGVDSALFSEICALSRAGGDAQDPHWREMIGTLAAATRASEPLVFPRGAMLVNVGTSWWLPNYFLYVRRAKAASAVRYVPLIYDLIPMLTPDYCDPELVEEFIGWFVGVLQHADFYLAISEATKADLIAYAEKIGRPIAADRIAVVPLDADFRNTRGTETPAPSRFDEPYAMFVSTLEARKNQLGALDAWATLIARHGSRKVPRLILLGKRGFASDPILQKLAGSADLAERVTILSTVEDRELHTLYENALFTLYPSFYEGWGLPVTESLCYGKVPLIADNSSLPEAGGPHALYFKTGSTTALVASLERILFEKGFLDAKQAEVRARFRPRRWSDIAAGMVDTLARWNRAEAAVEHRPPMAARDAYYPMRRNRSRRVWAGMGSAEVFRAGLNWFRVENRGCHTKRGGGEIAMRVSQGGPLRIGFELLCPPGLSARYRIEAAGLDSVVEGHIENDKWVFLDIAEVPENAVLRFILRTRVLAEGDSDQEGRPLGIGLAGFFLFDDHARSRIDFVERVALGALQDLDHYRDRAA